MTISYMNSMKLNNTPKCQKKSIPIPTFVRSDICKPTICCKTVKCENI